MQRIIDGLVDERDELLLRQPLDADGSGPDSAEHAPRHLPGLFGLGGERIAFEQPPRRMHRHLLGHRLRHARLLACVPLVVGAHTGAVGLLAPPQPTRQARALLGVAHDPLALLGRWRRRRRTAHWQCRLRPRERARRPASAAPTAAAARVCRERFAAAAPKLHQLSTPGGSAAAALAIALAIAALAIALRIAALGGGRLAEHRPGRRRRCGRRAGPRGRRRSECGRLLWGGRGRGGASLEAALPPEIAAAAPYATRLAKQVAAAASCAIARAAAIAAAATTAAAATHRQYQRRVDRRALALLRARHPRGFERIPLLERRHQPSLPHLQPLAPARLHEPDMGERPLDHLAHD